MSQKPKLGESVIAVLKPFQQILMIFGLAVFVFAANSYSEEKKKAEYVGMSTCADCHSDVAERFKLNTHYQAQDAEDEAELGSGCEACHGPGSVHAESQDKKDIQRPSYENCFNCHIDKKSQFQLQYHHPVTEGRINCSDCHNIHAAEIENSEVTTLRKSDQVCFKCHKELKGPFIFEHDPMRDGCQVCHDPHGSVYDKLLVADQTNVCLRCHWEPGFNTANATLGGVKHSPDTIGRGEECVDHHRAPHGSNIWRTLNR